ncbi:hypothetical protein ALC60_00629, partial [Trachymyrmex zeteki]
SESEPFSPSNWRSKLVFSVRSLEFISSSSLRSFSSFSKASCAFLAFSSSACNEAISPSILPPFTSGIGFSISTVSPIIDHPRRKNRSIERRYGRREKPLYGNRSLDNRSKTEETACGTWGYDRSLLTSRRYRKERLEHSCKNIYNRSDTTFQEGESREGKEQLMSAEGGSVLDEIRSDPEGLKNCCNFSLVKLMQSCSKPLNCEIPR